MNKSKTILNLEVFKERKFNFLVVSVLSVQTMFLDLSFLLPIYLQMALEQIATQAGFFMFPGSLIVALTTPLAGIVFDRRGPFIPIFSGMSIIVLVMVVISVFFEHLTVTQLLMGNIAVMVGAAFTIGNLVTHTLSQLRPDLQADGNSILNTWQQFTGAAATTMITKIFFMTLTQTTHVFTAGKLSISFIAFILLMGLISYVSYSRMKAVVEEELVV
ncbi:MFS transporter [Aerococcaceae bacterium WGS1372]